LFASVEVKAKIPSGLGQFGPRIRYLFVRTEQAATFSPQVGRYFRPGEHVPRSHAAVDERATA